MVSIVISYFITDIGDNSFTLSSIVLRALPGILIGVVIGLTFPRIPLFLGQISLGW